jgi:hypothetical protein
VDKRDDVTLVRPGNDFYLDVARGIVTDTDVYHLFGRNPDVGTTLEDIWTVGAMYTWQTNAFTIEAISTDAADTAAGAGARTICVKGLAADWSYQEEILTMNGTSASAASTGSWIRINESVVVDSGTYASDTITGTQEGDITVRISSAGATQLELLDSVKYGHSQTARYSVPLGKTAYVRRIEANVSGSKAANIFFWERKGADVVSAPFTPKVVLVEFDEVVGEELIEFDAPLRLPEKTDFWMSGNRISGGAGNTVIDTEVEIIIIDN